jgi:hypothetical protein
LPHDPATIRLQHTLKMVAGLCGFQEQEFSQSRELSGAPGEDDLRTFLDNLVASLSEIDFSAVSSLGHGGWPTLRFTFISIATHER